MVHWYTVHCTWLVLKCPALCPAMCTTVTVLEVVRGMWERSSGPGRGRQSFYPTPLKMWGRNPLTGLVTPKLLVAQWRLNLEAVNWQLELWLGG